MDILRSLLFCLGLLCCVVFEIVEMVKGKCRKFQYEARMMFGFGHDTYLLDVDIQPLAHCDTADGWWSPSYVPQTVDLWLYDCHTIISASYLFLQLYRMGLLYTLIQ